MPNRRVHVGVGLAVGVGAGVVTATRLPAEQQVLQVLTAGIGGIVGSLTPDVLEPATSPNHRAAFHSLAAGASLTAAWVADWAADCRQRALECEARASAAINPDAKSWEAFKAFLWRALAGFLIGFFAGYASHLVLDVGTSRGLPIMNAAF